MAHQAGQGNGKLRRVIELQADQGFADGAVIIGGTIDDRFVPQRLHGLLRVRPGQLLLPAETQRQGCQAGTADAWMFKDRLVYPAAEAANGRQDKIQAGLQPVPDAILSTRRPDLAVHCFVWNQSLMNV